jgi:predicted N-acetyltransferase YhbS
MSKLIFEERIMIFRMECEKDYLEVENLTREAFWNVYRPGCTEHFVLHNLRMTEAFIQELDYVAVENGKLIGSIIYARMFTEPGHRTSNEIICFGPISVHPDYQKKGIGRELIKLTIEKARTLGYKAILITGNNQYYNPLGFTSATSNRIYLPDMDASDEAVYFMSMDLECEYLKNHSGVYDFDKSYYDVTGFEEFDIGFPRKQKREAKQGDLI